MSKKESFSFSTFATWSSIIIFLVVGFGLRYAGIEFGHEGSGSNSSKFAGLVTFVIALPVIVVFNLMAYFVFRAVKKTSA